MKKKYQEVLSFSDDLTYLLFQMADFQCLTEEKKNLLIAKAPDLIKYMRTSTNFWAVLRKHNVLSHNDISRIQVSSLPQEFVTKVKSKECRTDIIMPSL